MRMGIETVICAEHVGVSGFIAAEMGLSRGCSRHGRIALV